MSNRTSIFAPRHGKTNHYCFKQWINKKLQNTPFTFAMFAIRASDKLGL
jgi:hypothetical protein